MYTIIVAIHHRKLIEPILLAEGLEYEHTAILDAAVLDSKELYVETTRGPKSLASLQQEGISNKIAAGKEK